MKRRDCGGCADATSLELGARGAFERQAFRLVGSVHVVSRAGGHWHEWRAALDGGGEAWLAEGSGAFYWMREGALEPWKSTAPGARFAPDFVVVERGRGTRVATTGDVPFARGETFEYVDLSGPGGAFATVDYGVDGSAAGGTSRTHGDVARTFVGRRVTLGQLGLGARAGRRSFLRVSARGFEPLVAPGAKVTLERTPYEVLGVLARSAHEKGKKQTWPWEEYLLWAPSGVRWLVLADGHWSVAKPIEAGDVREDGRGRVYGKKVFRPLGEALARVDAAAGEFPWEVRVGQEATTADWAHAPNTLSRETTGDELAWSLLTSLDPKQAARALGRSDLPKRHGRAPNQTK